MIPAALFSPDEATKKAVRDLFKVDAISIKRDIEILKDWIKQQPHLPQGSQDDDFLEKFLVRNKFSVERTKEKIEKYYTIKAVHAASFVNIEVILPSQSPNLILQIAEVTESLERIILVKLNHKPIEEDDDVVKFFKHAVCASEYYLRSDYVAGIRIVQDFDNFTFNDFKKYAAKFSAYGTTYQEAYSSKVLGIEYINLPPFMDIFMQACKAMMKPKVFKRITVHKNLESLYKNVDRKYLPKEYGGYGKTIKEYLDEWDKEFETHIEWFDKVIATEIADETARVGNVKTNDAFGVSGTFKSLNLD